MISARKRALAAGAGLALAALTGCRGTQEVNPNPYGTEVAPPPAFGAGGTAGGAAPPTPTMFGSRGAAGAKPAGGPEFARTATASPGYDMPTPPAAIDVPDPEPISRAEIEQVGMRSPMTQFPASGAGPATEINLDPPSPPDGAMSLPPPTQPAGHSSAAGCPSGACPPDLKLPPVSGPAPGPLELPAPASLPPLPGR